MAFDVKELMIDITKAAGSAYHACQPTIACHYPTYHFCTLNTHCFNITFVPCRFGTYTCFNSIITCGGTIYCAGSNDPTILYQGIDRETFSAIKEQLTSALQEVEKQEKQLAQIKK